MNIFPGDYNLSDLDDWEQMFDAVGRNVIILNGEINPVTGITVFHRGYLKNLTFSSAGTFGIGVTLTMSDGQVIGHGVGDERFILEDAIHISPPETLLTIKSNNIMIGLAWLAVALSLIITGINIIMRYL